METRSLDLRGRVCPEPYIIALKEFSKLPQGARMEVLMDSWKCALLLVESVKQLGIGEAVLREEGEQVYRIELVKTAGKTVTPLTSSC